MPLAREACGSRIPVVSPEYSSETPSERSRFPEEISLSPPELESSNPENIKNTL